MCAIVGFLCSSPTDEAINTLRKVFIESKIRGMHAYGFASIQDGLMSSFKSNTLRPVLEAIHKPKALIGHCRYSTSGDYIVEANNQPLRYKDEYMVFNGVIDMRTKPEMEKAYGIQMSCDNDGEIMLQTTNRLGLLGMNVSFAGLFLNKDVMTFMRNPNRPAYIGFKHGATYIASTADILKRSLISDWVGLEPYEEYKWAV